MGDEPDKKLQASFLHTAPVSEAIEQAEVDRQLPEDPGLKTDYDAVTAIVQPAPPQWQLGATVRCKITSDEPGGAYGGLVEGLHPALIISPNHKLEVGQEIVTSFLPNLLKGRILIHYRGPSKAQE